MLQALEGKSVACLKAPVEALTMTLVHTRFYAYGALKVHASPTTPKTVPGAEGPWVPGVKILIQEGSPMKPFRPTNPVHTSGLVDGTDAALPTAIGRTWPPAQVFEETHGDFSFVVCCDYH